VRLYGLFFVLLSKKAFSACLVAEYCERCGPAVPAGNGDIQCENVIKQLDIDFALDKLCLKKFFATEAAMAFSVLAYNLCVLFQRHLGWMDRVTAATLRFRLFTTGGIISKSGGRTTIRLAADQRAWWRRFFEKLLSPFPNCNSLLPSLETRFHGCSNAPDGPPLFWRVSFYTSTGPSEARHFGTKEAALAFHAEVVERIKSGQFEFPLP
jgi:Transposase DDE domain group 1